MLMVSWLNFCAFNILGDLAFGEPFHAFQSGKQHPWVSSMFINVKAGNVLEVVGFYLGAGFFKVLGLFPAVKHAIEDNVKFTREKLEL